MRERLLGLLLGIFLSLACFSLAFGQQTGGGGGGGGTGGGGTGGGGGPTGPGGGTTTPTSPTRPTMPTTPNTPNQQDRTRQPPIGDFQRPLYLAGKVMMDDGTPPPETAVIELVCGGQPRPQGYTDTKGRFSFEVGRNQALMADASVSGAPDLMGGGSSNNSMNDPMALNTIPGQKRGLSERDLAGCDLRANLAGFRSDLLQLNGRRVLDNPDVGTILLHRLANVSGFTYSMTTGAAPKDARKLFEKGSELANKNKLKEAGDKLAAAVELYPKYAVAWQELGRVREAENKNEEARKAYLAALEADSKFVLPYLRLAAIAAREQKWADVIGSTTTVLKLNPFDFPQAYFLNSVANLSLNNLDDAEKSAREAIKLDPQHRMPKVYHVLGVVLAQKRDYEGALGSMKSYLSFAPQATDRDYVSKQITELEKASGKQVVVQK